MLALGLDTSCYTTSAALCGDSLAPQQRRQLLPVPAGERGLRQSEAVFAHVRQLSQVLLPLLENAPGPIDCVCASVSPRDGEDSYMPVFQVGASHGRAIAAALQVPFYETTHQRGHLAAAKWGTDLKSEKYIALHLSGGTTDVLLKEKDFITPLGTSVDLHAGQLVDRVGVALSLPFPCGPYLEELARKGESRARIPVSMENQDLSCHLSGAEAQLMRLVASGERKEDIAAEVYSVLSRTVLRLLAAAAEKTGVRDMLLAGGVASSALFRELLHERNEKRRMRLKLHFGRPEFSGDNAVGAALIGLEKHQKEKENGSIAGW